MVEVEVGNSTSLDKPTILDFTLTPGDPGRSAASPTTAGSKITDLMTTLLVLIIIQHFNIRI